MANRSRCRRDYEGTWPQEVSRPCSHRSQAAPQRALKLVISSILVAILASPASLPTLARQSSSDKKTTNKTKFGSSLNQLKWDSKKRVALERANKPESNSPSKDVLKLETLLVSLDVLVVDSATSRPINGLTKNDFVITEDGQLQQIHQFALGDDPTLARSVILIIDYSYSQENVFETSIEAAKVLVSQLGPEDKMAIVTDDVEMLSDFTRFKPQLIAVLDALKKKWISGKRGRSRQYNSLMAALRELVDRESQSIIIFQTDGDELIALKDQPRVKVNAPEFGSPEFGLVDVYLAVETSPATVYSVITNIRALGVPREDAYYRVKKRIEANIHRHKTELEYSQWIDLLPITKERIDGSVNTLLYEQTALANVAFLTGGQVAYLEQGEQAERIYSEILSDMHRRYIIGYYPTNTRRDGGRRKVRVEVRGHPEYLVHGRRSYYSPSEKIGSGNE